MVRYTASMGTGNGESNEDIVARLAHLEDVVRGIDRELGEKASRDQVAALEARMDGLDHKISDTRIELRREIARLAQATADGHNELKGMLQRVIDQQGS